MITRWLYRHEEGLSDPAMLDEIWQTVVQEKVEFLDLSKNQFSTIRFPDYPLPSLLVLDISGNQADIEELVIPAELFPNLKYLYLKGSQIKGFSIKGVPQCLDTLDLSANKLSEFRLPIHTYPALNVIKLKGNDINHPAKEHWEGEGEFGNGYNQLKAYLSESEKGTVINDRAKLIIVGNGRVGKTSLFKVLKGEECDPDEKYTHGINFGHLDKEHHFPEFEGESLRLNVWDFGGQTIFYALHQLFLSKNALYVLAWTGENNIKGYRNDPKLPKDKNYRPNDYWLENIKHLGGEESPIVLVETHGDILKNRTKADIPSGFNVTDDIRISSTKKWGLDELKRYLLYNLNGLRDFGAKEPITYEKVIELIEVEKAAQHYISLDRYYAFCQQANVEKGNELVLLRLLHQRGIALYFDAHSPSLSDTIFIDPDWLAGQMYRLIDNKLEGKKGEFDRDYVNTVWTDKTSLEQDQLIELLLNFKLIFQPNRENKQQFIAPQYLPKVPDGSRMIGMLTKALKGSFIIRFPKYIPDNLIVNFWSQYGPLANKSYWKNGICFETAQGRLCQVLFRAYDGRDRLINELQVYTKNEDEDELLIQEVFDLLMKLGRGAYTEVALEEDCFVELHELEGCFGNTHTVKTVDKKRWVGVADFARLFGGIKMQLVDQLHGQLKQEKRVLTAFANEDIGESGRLRCLNEEMRQVDEEFFKARYICRSLANASLKSIMSRFYRYDGQITIFHYGGHGNSWQLLLRNQQPAHSEGFIPFLAERKGLKLVFLNACSTHEQAKELASRANYCVIATHAEINDEIARIFAGMFYQIIGEKQSIRTSFQTAKQYVQATKGTANIRDLLWEDIPNEKSQAMNHDDLWGLFAAKEEYKDWKLIEN